MRDIIINLQESDTWKIQFTISIAFISSKDIYEERVMHSKSDNMELMIMQMKLVINLSSNFFKDTKLVWKNQRGGAI